MADDHSSSTSRRRFLEATGAAGTAVALGGLASAGSDAGSGRTVLVGYRASADPDEVTSNLPENAEILRHQPALRVFEVQIDEDRGTYAYTSTAATIASEDEVKFTEESMEWTALGASADDDSALGEDRTETGVETAASNDPYFTRQYAPQQVRADEAWGETYGSDGVTIAVVDTGCDYTHPDLRDRFGSVKGKDFVTEDDDPMPEYSNEYHATHVAGIAAATTNNASGIAGISNSRLLSCRCLGGAGRGSTFDVIDGVRWAADNGADVINMSLGGGSYSSAFKNAISYAASRDVLIVCAAGNDAKRGVHYPAKFDECVAVSAIDEDENFASFSQYGPSVDVTAPGVNVFSSFPGGDYEYLDGTSMACPVASGVAALGKAVNPGLSATQLRQRLKDTAVDVGLPAEKQGAGRVDALRMVGGSGGGTPDPCTTTTHKRDEMSATLSGYGDSATYTYELQTNAPTEVTVDLDGPDDADFDLYLTGDGREPSRSDYDHRSTGYGADETITLGADEFAADSPLGLSVTSYRANGEFTLTVEEAGSVETTDCGGGDGGDGGDGACGSATNVADGVGLLSNPGDYERYYYVPQTDPCQITIRLDGPSDADFDLYVYTPSGLKRSETSNSNEQIVVDDAVSDERLWIYVYAKSNDGVYEIAIEEVGK